VIIGLSITILIWIFSDIYKLDHIGKDDFLTEKIIK